MKIVIDSEALLTEIGKMRGDCEHYVYTSILGMIAGKPQPLWAEELREEEAEAQFVTFYLDEQPTDQQLAEMELALNSRAPEWGEYELAFCRDGNGISMHSNSRESGPEETPTKEAVEALKFLLEGLGYKVTEVAGETREAGR